MINFGASKTSSIAQAKRVIVTAFCHRLSATEFLVDQSGVENNISQWVYGKVGPDLPLRQIEEKENTVKAERIRDSNVGRPSGERSTYRLYNESSITSGVQRVPHMEV